MKKFLILTLLLMLVAPSLALPDLYDQLRGKQMVGDKGAPWYADNAINYFGTGKDAALTYNPTFDKLFINDTDVYLEEDVTVAGNLAVSGSTISNGKTTDPFYVDDLFYVSNTSALNYTTVTDIRASDDGYIVDVLSVGGTSALNKTTIAGTVDLAVNASTVLSTVLTSSSTKTVYGIDASGANRTLTLPDAATVTGRSYFIGTNVDPGSYYVKITATGSDKLGGTGGFTIAQTTDGKAGMTVVSDGTLYIITGAYGTWAEGTA